MTLKNTEESKSFSFQMTKSRKHEKDSKRTNIDIELLLDVAQTELLTNRMLYSWFLSPEHGKMFNSFE